MKLDKKGKTWYTSIEMATKSSNFKFKPEIKKLLAQLAEARGLSMTQLLTALVLEAARAELEK